MAQRDGFGNLPVTGLLAVLIAIVGAILWKNVPLDVRRPSPAPPLKYEELGLQDVNARLWDDPFAAAARAPDINAPSDSRRTLTKVCEQLRERVRGNSKFLVLGVMVSKAPYADGDEQRRRIRYAVVSALNVAHFVPENAEHLGYFRWDSRTIVPFELFRRKNRSALGFDLVGMILWLEDEAFSNVHAPGSSTPGIAPTPVFKLNQLAQDVKTQCSTSTDPLDDSSYQFQVVGPAQSSSLRAMIEELDHEPDVNPAAAGSARVHLSAVDFYSPFATASETELLRRRRTEPPGPAAQNPFPCRVRPRAPGCSVHRFFSDKGVRFLQATATDDQLALSLVDELELRGAPVRTAAGERHHVALVSEWDTYYGRMLPSAFMRAAGQERACETDMSEPQLDVAERARECRVLRFSYLRGVDGQVPGAAAPAQSEKPPAGTRDALPAENADGPAQLDYLRRLTARIEAESARLRRIGAGEIGAIGVLGSDVYDKITVLRALRTSFPRAVFFTTDLDARLLNPEEYDWTRNLVVASSFDLQLSPCLQRHIPAFRGNYQTAAYFATRVALHNAFPGFNTYRDDRCPALAGRNSNAAEPPADVASAAISQERLATWLQSARLFELGRTRPINLREPGGSCPGLAKCTDIHPADGDLRNVRGLLAGLALLVVILALMCVSRITRPVLMEPLMLVVDAARGRLSSGSGAAVLLPALLFVWLVLAIGMEMVVSVSDPRGEPFVWIQGVSVWPSELIRLLALVLGACSLVYLFRTIQRNDIELERDFHIPFADDHRGLWQRIGGEFAMDKTAVGAPRIAVLWGQYLRSGHWSVIILWSLLWTFAFLVLAGVLFAAFGAPNHPVRGMVAERLDKILVLATVFVFVILLFSVNATIRLGGNLIDELITQADVRDWPPQTRRQFAQQVGMKPDLDDKLSGQILDPWIDIQFIARRTAAIGPLLYLPFVLLALMVVARWSVFDDWDIPIALAIVFGFGFTVACVNAFLMQRAATRARRLALDRLQSLALMSKGQAAGAYPVPAHLDAMIEALSALRQGAFVPFTEQPLVRAALIPFGSAGGLYLVQLFALASA